MSPYSFSQPTDGLEHVKSDCTGFLCESLHRPTKSQLLVRVKRPYLGLPHPTLPDPTTRGFSTSTVSVHKPGRNLRRWRCH